MRNLLTIIMMSVIGLLSAQNVDVEVVNGKYFNLDGNLFTGTYTEYAEGIKISELNIEEGVLSGSVLYFHLNGNLKEQGQYNNGLKTGDWKQYNSVGSITSTATFVDDKKDGQWMVWDDAGNKRFEMYYSNGKKVGVWKMWDDKGEMTTKDFGN
ncbi:MAG: hypothetical protein HKP14_01730 [Bacteroidia bacterium]|nr:hypothetical protein [Bacteroidia bacterium]